MSELNPLRLAWKAGFLATVIAVTMSSGARAASPWVVPPTNDQCAGAEVLPGAFGLPLLSAITADITDATLAGDPPPQSCQANISRSIWYSYTPMTTALHRISSCADAPTASTVDDTVMGVYSTSGGCGGTFAEVTCNDDACANEVLQAVSTAQLTAGRQYLIVVWKFDPTPPTLGNTAVQLLLRSLALFADGFQSGDTSEWDPCLASGAACVTNSQCCSALCNAGFCI